MLDLQEYRALEAAPAVRTEGLVRRFGDTEALRGVDLTVAAGEVYGFLGPNGAGKTTLIRILCTLVRPSGGRAAVAGHDVVAEPHEVRLRIGCALQSAALDEGQTGRELLALQGRLYGLRRRQVRRRVDEVLDLVAIGDAIDRRIGSYSGGMKRRVDLAAALVHDPDVVFLDEPTTGLDPGSRDRVWDEVARLNRELGKTIFLTTQYLEEADALAGRVGIISSGVLVAEGTPRELKRGVGRDVIELDLRADAATAVSALADLDEVDSAVSEGSRLVVSTPDAASLLMTLAGELGRRGIEVTSLAVRTPTLDDVFRELTRDRAT
ncbi:MAG: ATP-binding cassette domain-containing protein, partial [Acidimicrobiales bacterium]|nr:ATP-binding cassette domain-containing protein [Acidimicrobiales bacterium]